MEATGVRRDACRRARSDRLVPGEAARSAGHPGQPRHGAGQHGHLRVRRRSSSTTSCAATPPTRNSAHDFGNDIIPYLVKHGKAVAHRFAKSCVKSKAEVRGLLARCRHRRRLFRGQHGPHPDRPGARPVRRELADLDLCRDHPAGQVRPRRGRPARHGGELAGLGRLHRLRRLPARAPCCSPACTSIPTPAWKVRWCCPRSRSAAHARLSRVVIDRGRANPARAW